MICRCGCIGYVTRFAENGDPWCEIVRQSPYCERTNASKSFYEYKSHAEHYLRPGDKVKLLAYWSCDKAYIGAVRTLRLIFGDPPVLVAQDGEVAFEERSGPCYWPLAHVEKVK